MKNNDYELEKYAILNNIVSIICFTILAILFNKWWIVFFSILFFKEVKYKGE